MFWPAARLRNKPYSLKAIFLSWALFLVFTGIDRSIWHAWISLKWPRAEAEIFEVSPPGAWRSGFWGVKGYPFIVTILVRTADGREFPGQIIEPLSSLFLTAESIPKGAIGAAPPRPGDLIVVHLHPSGDGRVMPRDNLVDGGGSIFLHFWYFIILLVLLLTRAWQLRNA
jgi:hypothetical protein